MIFHVFVFTEVIFSPLSQTKKAGNLKIFPISKLPAFDAVFIFCFLRSDVSGLQGAGVTAPSNRLQGAVSDSEVHPLPTTPGVHNSTVV